MSGNLDIVLSSTFFSLMTLLMYTAQSRFPEASSLISSFTRVWVNLVVLVIPALFQGSFKELFGDFRASLWLRGAFGTLSAMFGFFALKVVGPADSAFLFSSHAVFTTLLGPLILKQKNGIRTWMAVLGALLGLFILLKPNPLDLHPYGRISGIVAAFCAAIAYMMISRSSESNSAKVIVFYFCLVATVIHVLALFFVESIWPKDWIFWGLLVASGLLASVAQYFMTRAFQKLPVVQCSVMSYLQPVLTVILSALMVMQVPEFRTIVGSIIVLGSGVYLVFLKSAPH